MKFSFRAVLKVNMITTERFVDQVSRAADVL